MKNMIVGKYIVVLVGVFVMGCAYLYCNSLLPEMFQCGDYVLEMILMVCTVAADKLFLFCDALRC